MDFSSDEGAVPARSLKSVKSSPLVAHALRLLSGEDLRQALIRFACDTHLTAACVLSFFGTLKVAVLHMPGGSHPQTIEGSLLITALSGNLSQNGCHLLLSVSDSNRIFSGFLLDGCIIQTTAEIILGELSEMSFSYSSDARTRQSELSIQSNSSSSISAALNNTLSFSGSSALSPSSCPSPKPPLSTSLTNKATNLNLFDNSDNSSSSLSSSSSAFPAPLQILSSLPPKSPVPCTPSSSSGGQKRVRSQTSATTAAAFTPSSSQSLRSPKSEDSFSGDLPPSSGTVLLRSASTPSPVSRRVSENSGFSAWGYSNALPQHPSLVGRVASSDRKHPGERKETGEEASGSNGELPSMAQSNSWMPLRLHSRSYSQGNIIPGFGRVNSFNSAEEESGPS